MDTVLKCSQSTQEENKIISTDIHMLEVKDFWASFSLLKKNHEVTVRDPKIFFKIQIKNFNVSISNHFI